MRLTEPVDELLIGPTGGLTVDVQAMRIHAVQNVSLDWSASGITRAVSPATRHLIAAYFIRINVTVEAMSDAETVRAYKDCRQCDGPPGRQDPQDHRSAEGIQSYLHRTCQVSDTTGRRLLPTPDQTHEYPVDAKTGQKYIDKSMSAALISIKRSEQIR